MPYGKEDTKRLGKDDEVSHVVGSGEDRRNWKSYWQTQTGRNFPKYFQIYNCGNPAEVGAHVYNKGN